MNEERNSDYANEGSHPTLTTDFTAEKAIERLKQGNVDYLASHMNTGDISAELVGKLADHGQAPFACIVACADSRVVPEHIFMTGLGELFCIRVAGNVMGRTQLASCVYAAEHLGVKLIVVLGHTHCGAIEAAMEDGDSEVMAPLLERIRQAIGDERDPQAASELNVRATMAALHDDPAIMRCMEEDGLQVAGALYDTHTGAVSFL